MVDGMNFEARMALLKRAEEKLTLLFMCDVPARYALVFRCGLDRREVASLDLTGSPNNCTIAVVMRFMTDRRTLEWMDQFFQLVDQQPLPDGIPESME